MTNAFPAILKALNNAVDEGVFPGAVLLAAWRGEVRVHEAVGFAALKPRKISMTRFTIFDLASLTKPIATTTAVMRLVDRGALDIDDPVRRWIPEFSGGEKDRIRVRDLLNHCSGLRAWEPLYKEVIKTAKRRNGYVGSPDAKQQVLNRIHHGRLVYPPGAMSLYSDLGFVLLGEIIERVSGLGLDRFCRDQVFRPLGLKRSFFIRTGKPHAGRFAATERSDWRRGIVVGQVHDDNAYAMGGIAGHAGLFATAADLNRFSQTILDALRGRNPFVSQKIVESFVTRQTTPGSSWGLGWDTPSGSSGAPSSSGRLLSARSFGHLGFTGTSLWIDPEKDLTIILLTNRVHPTSRNIKIRKFRPALHDLVVQEFIPGIRS
ncbi:MAG TPA: serine hydrolase domain-containing protein [Nitrospiria bacterium]|jgi:CubicO group peptidase (beta-lactamase class C family)|nr:serine hydrolase domain-containing protein [Nitrospiria bacterium]